MAKKTWTGNADAVAQVVTVTPANIGIGDVFILEINNKQVRFTATAATVANVVDGLIEAIENSDIPEFAEIAASVGSDEDGNTTHLVLTGRVKGRPFTVTADTSDAGNLSVDVTTLVDGVSPQNEKQEIRFPGTPTGGTFTLTFAGQTTGEIDFDATRFDVRDALCDLSNIDGTDAVQAVDVSEASSGTFTLTFDGQTTAPIAHDAAAETVQSALEALSNIEVGDIECVDGPLGSSPVVITFRNNLGRKDVPTLQVTDSTDGTASVSVNTPGVDSDVTVTGDDGGPWTVEFGGQYAGINVPLMTADGSSLTGGNTITHATTTQGATGTNEVQKITLNGNEQGSYRFGWTYDDNTYYTGIIAGDDSGLTLVDMSNFLGDLCVAILGAHLSVSGPTGGPFLVEFDGTLAGQNVAQIFTEVVSGSPNLPNIETITAGSATGVNEVQTVTLSTAPTGGTWTISFEDQTTDNLDYNADAATVKSALESLSNIDEVTVVRSGSGTAASPYKYTITFEDPGSQDVEELSSDASSLTGMSILVTTTQTASAGVNEVQLVEVDSNAAGGTFTLTFDGQTTAAIAYNASAAAVKTALEALSNIDPDEVAVSGLAGGPYTVTFQNGLGNQDVAELTGDGSSLTGSGTQALTVTTTTAATGPNHWGNADNWSSAAVPENGDDVYFQHSSVPVLYELDQSAITLNSLNIDGTYTGQIGLPTTNAEGGYHEYRNTYLAIGATTINIGRNGGSGSSLIKIDTGSVQTTINVYVTASAQEAGLAAVIWKGTNASNVVNVFRGSFGAAIFAGETATIATLRQGFEDNQDGDTEVLLGEGVTITTIEKNGGTAQVNSNVTTLKNNGGEVAFNDGTLGTLNIRSGRIVHRATGTITNLIVSGGGNFDRSGETRGVTITNTTLYSGATLLDPNRTITFTNAIQLPECSNTEVTLELGTNISLQVASL